MKQNIFFIIFIFDLFSYIIQTFYFYTSNFFIPYALELAPRALINLESHWYGRLFKFVLFLAKSDWNKINLTFFGKKTKISPKLARKMSKIG